MVGMRGEGFESCVHRSLNSSPSALDHLESPYRTIKIVLQSALIFLV